VFIGVSVAVWEYTLELSLCSSGECSCLWMHVRAWPMIIGVSVTVWGCTLELSLCSLE